MISYVIVGSGYRSEYFARVAAAHPDLFRALYLCRSAEKAALMTARTGLPATVSAEECLAFGPDFAVVAVDRGHIAQVTAEWARRGVPVVCGCLRRGLTPWPGAISASRSRLIFRWCTTTTRQACCGGCC